MSAALWSIRGLLRGLGEERIDGPRARAPGLEHVDVRQAPPVVALEVVAGGADQRRGPRQVFADVVIVDRRVAAKLLDEPTTQRRLLRVASQGPSPELGHEVAAVDPVADGHEPGEVVGAGGDHVDRVARPAEDAGAGVDRLGEAVAQPDGSHRGVAVEGQADPVRRVRVAEQHRVRRQGFDVATDLEHERDRAERMRQPARSAVLGQDAGEPVAQARS